MSDADVMDDLTFEVWALAEHYRRLERFNAFNDGSYRRAAVIRVERVAPTKSMVAGALPEEG